MLLYRFLLDLQEQSGIFTLSPLGGLRKKRYGTPWIRKFPGNSTFDEGIKEHREEFFMTNERFKFQHIKQHFVTPQIHFKLDIWEKEDEFVRMIIIDYADLLQRTEWSSSSRMRFEGLRASQEGHL